MRLSPAAFAAIDLGIALKEAEAYLGPRSLAQAHSAGLSEVEFQSRSYHLLPEFCVESDRSYPPGYVSVWRGRASSSTCTRKAFKTKKVAIGFGEVLGRRALPGH